MTTITNTRFTTAFRYSTAGLSPQAKVVYAHIAKAGSITQREAIVDHSVQSLTRRISEIRDHMIGITAESRRHPITGQRYARYSFTNPQHA